MTKIIKPPPELDGGDADFIPPQQQHNPQHIQPEALHNSKTTEHHPTEHPTATQHAAPAPQQSQSVSPFARTPTKGAVALLVLGAILGNFVALKLTATFGMGLLWSAVLAGVLVYIFYQQRQLDQDLAKWQANFELLKARTARILANPNESAEWLNAALRSGWSAALPSIQPRAKEALNKAIDQTELNGMIRQLRCSDLDLSDACPTFIHVSCMYADKVAGSYPKSNNTNQSNAQMVQQSTNQAAQTSQSVLSNIAGLVSNQQSNLTLSPGGTDASGHQNFQNRMEQQSPFAWLSSIFGPKAKLNQPNMITQLQTPAIAMDVDLLLETQNSKATFRCRLAYLPFEVQAVLHQIRMQATMRVFIEFDHSLAFPHIARLSATFLEPPEVRFDLTMSQQVEMHRMPMISTNLHAYLMRFLIKNAMYPDWFDVYSSPALKALSPLTHHIQYPTRTLSDMIQHSMDQAEPFRAAMGILVIEARLIPRGMNQPINAAVTNSGQQQLMALNMQPQMPSGDSWVVLQLQGHKRYEQIDLPRGQQQACRGKYAFLVQNCDTEHLRIEAWTKRGNLSVKTRQLQMKAADLYKSPSGQASGSIQNRIELPLLPWNCSIHISTSFTALGGVPLSSLLPQGFEMDPSFPSHPSMQKHNMQAYQAQQELQGGEGQPSLAQRRLQTKPAPLATPPRMDDGKPSSLLGPASSSNQLCPGGVLFLRLRNLNIRTVAAPSSETCLPGLITHQRFVYCLVSLNGQLIACSPQHPRGDSDSITTALLQEFELIVPPPLNPQHNPDLEFTVEFMLNDNPIKSLHSRLGTCSFSWKLPANRPDATGQSTALSPSSKNLQVSISRARKTGEPRTEKPQGPDVGQIGVDIHFRPVVGLEETQPSYQLTNPFKIDQNATEARRTVMFDAQSAMDVQQQRQAALLSAQEFFELTLIGAGDLQLPNPNSLGDIFAKVKLNEKVIHSTKVKPSTLEPQWNERCKLPALSEWDRVVIELWDHDFVSKSNYVGHITLTGDEFGMNAVPVLPQLQPQFLQQQQQQQQQNNRLSPLGQQQQQNLSGEQVEKLQQQQMLQSSIWLPLAENNGLVELLIVNLQPQSNLMQQQQQQQQTQQTHQLHRYQGSASSMSYFRPQNQYQPMSPLASVGDLHLTNPSSPEFELTSAFNERIDSAGASLRRASQFNRASSAAVPGSAGLHRQSAINFGSTEALSTIGVMNQQDATLRPTSPQQQLQQNQPNYNSFSLDNLTSPPQQLMSTSMIMPSTMEQQYMQNSGQGMFISEAEREYAMQQQQQQQQAQKGLLLEAALLASSSSANVRVTLIVCLLEVRGNLASLIGRPQSSLPGDHPQSYITVKISKKNTAKTFEVFSTTLAKSRPLPVQEPLPDSGMIPSVQANITFQLQDMRLDGVVKLVVTPMEISSAAAAQVSSVSRPMAAGSQLPSVEVKPPVFSTKPQSPIIDWSCDVRELLAGGTQEFDPSVTPTQSLSGRPGGMPNVGVSRRVRFFVAPPDVCFVFRVTQVFRPQLNAKPSSSSVSAAANAKRFGGGGSLRNTHFPSTVVSPPSQP